MDLISELIRTKEITLQYFELNDADLQKTYDPGKWNVKQILHHIADAEIVFHTRLKRVIANPDQIIWAFDQDAWCESLEYNAYPLVLNEAIYTAARDANVYLVERFLKSHGDTAFEHSATGARTLKDEMEKIASHNGQHLLQIERALGRYDHFKDN